MADTCALPQFAAIVVAAGKGMRAGGKLPKQFQAWRGKPLVRHSVERLLEHGAERVMTAIPEGGEAATTQALHGLTRFDIVIGGKTRQESVRNALEAIADSGHSFVLIHDAARPNLPLVVTQRLLAGLSEGEVSGAIPTLPVVDSVALVSKGPSGTQLMGDKADRDSLRRVQTPQAFRFDAILDAHRQWEGDADAGDDAQVLAAMKGSVALVQGDERLKKITFAEDFSDDMTPPKLRVGQGYDVHRLKKGEELWLGGVKIEHTHGLAGHSDADVALHAITDAVLGGIGDGDIGTHFPPSDPKWKGARSGQFLEHAVSLAALQGFTLGNIDLTIICEAPKIGPHRPAIRAEVARLTCLEESAVSIKATTTEKLGFTGRGEGIAAQAIVSLIGQETS